MTKLAKRFLVSVVLVALLVPLAGLLFCLLFNINPLILHPMLLLDGLDYAHARRTFEKQFSKPIATQEEMTKLLDEYDQIKGKGSSFNWRIRVQDAIRATARNPNTSSMFLAEIVRRDFENNLICEAVASNPNATPELLDRLAEHPDWLVLGPVIRHPRASSETLRKLYFDPKQDFYRRGNIAEHTNAPEQIVSAFVEEAVPSDDLMKRSYVAASRHASSQAVCSKLLENPDTVVRLKLAQNPAVPKSVLELLSHDSDVCVRRDALETIQKVKKDRFTRKARDFALDNKGIIKLIGSVPEFDPYDINCDAKACPSGGFEGCIYFRVRRPMDHSGCLIGIRWRSKDCENDFLPLEIKANSAVIWGAQ